MPARQVCKVLCSGPAAPDLLRTCHCFRNYAAQAFFSAWDLSASKPRSHAFLLSSFRKPGHKQQLTQLNLASEAILFGVLFRESMACRVWTTAMSSYIAWVQCWCDGKCDRGTRDAEARSVTMTGHSATVIRKLPCVSRLGPHRRPA